MTVEHDEYVTTQGTDYSARSIWVNRAARLLEQALAEIAGGEDPFAAVELALDALRVENSELPAFKLEGFPFPGEPQDSAENEKTDEDEEICVCPPDLMERGGYCGGCPVHGLSIVAGERAARGER